MDYITFMDGLQLLFQILPLQICLLCSTIIWSTENNAYNSNACLYTPAWMFMHVMMAMWCATRVMRSHHNIGTWWSTLFRSRTVATLCAEDWLHIIVSVDTVMLGDISVVKQFDLCESTMHASLASSILYS